MTPRANLALTMLSLELRNATTRQNKRLKRMDVRALAISTLLVDAKRFMRCLRHRIAKIEKLEISERKERVRDTRDRWAGVNRRQTGTYGK